MAKHGSGTGTTTTPEVPPIPPLPPFDPQQGLEIRLLNEAVLTRFAVTPDPMAPFGRAKFEWRVTMPTTVLPGVHVTVHIHRASDQLGEQVVDAEGHEIVAPYAGDTYTIALRTQLASRVLGTLDLPMDFATCTPVDIPPVAFQALIQDPVKKAFSPGGQVTLRHDPRVDLGIGSFVVDVPLTASVPDWFDADIDLSVGFDVVSANGSVDVFHRSASTDVSFGVASAILSGGCSAAVATALEAMSNGYLSGFIGPVIAGQIRLALGDVIDTNLHRLNTASPPPVPYRYYDLTLTDIGLTLRFCPAHPASPIQPPPVDGGLGGMTNGQ
ncbi:MAG: hypothetical protein ABJA87_11060 [bacterium]